MPKILGKVDGKSDGGQNMSVKGGFYIIVKTWKETHYVLADTANDSEDTILATTGLPALGASGHGGFLMDKKAKEIMTVIHPTTGVKTILYEVTCSYSSDINEDQADNAGEDPTDTRPKRRTYSIKEKIKYERDAVTGNALVTYANEPTPVEDDAIYTVLEITRYENYPWDLDINNTFVNRVNLNTFYGAPSGTVLCDDIRTEETTVNSQDYVLVTYVFKFKMDDDPENPGNFLPDTWMHTLLHNGYLHRVPCRDNDGNIVEDCYGHTETFMDAKGQPAKVNLDANGAILPPDQDPTYIQWWTKTKIDFSTLSLEF